MKSILKNLVGLHIDRAEMVHDYVQLRFDNDAVLNLYNKVDLIGQSREALAIPSIVGCAVKTAQAVGDAVELLMDRGQLLRISMLDADYRGPEAMEYIGADGARVVWS
jgi:hypothetical protein